MFSYLFGSSADGPSLPTIREGHKTVDVIIDHERLQVDVDVLAEVSGLFLQVQSTDAKECPLLDFPGGLERFRSIVCYLIDRDVLNVAEETVLDLLEATWLLECPSLLEGVMQSSFVLSLSSRRRAEILEHLLPYTAASSPADSEHAIETSGVGTSAQNDLGSWNEGLSHPQESVPVSFSCKQFLRLFHFETLMWQCTEKAALTLASQLDGGDFVLGPRLATGSLRVCSELLRLRRLREEESGFVSSAMQPVSALWKNLMDKPLRAKVAWDSHFFALRCMRRRLASAAPSEVLQKQAAMAGEFKEDEEVHDDLPADLVETAQDSTLLVFRELMAYVDTERLSPNWSALLVRVLLLLSRSGVGAGSPGEGVSRARDIFKRTFAENELMQKLASDPAPVPPAWLVDVVAHPSASNALLRVLCRYRQLEAEELSDIIEHVLLAKFLNWDHCHLILASELMNEILGACMDAGKKANSGAHVHTTQMGPERRCPDHWAGQHCLWRLEYLGRRLFHVSFLFQQGFLPHSFSSSSSSGSDSRKLLRKMAPEDDVCSPQPQVVEVTGSCLWDEGLLTIDLLRRTMMEGRAMLDKPILHYGRHVIMRHLWLTLTHLQVNNTDHKQPSSASQVAKNSYCEIGKLKILWDLACWPLCEDAGLVRQALEYLKGTYRDLCRPNGVWSAEHEEDLFQMFLAIDLSLLPIQVLHSPWIPAQVQSVRLFVQQQPADQFLQELQQEVSRAMEHLKSVNFQCSKFTNKLNAVEHRTLTNIGQINDASAALEEYQRKRARKEPKEP
ncbi:unnamed protein product [Durusdinium trenchii]|uniref:Nuclear pore complex protein n=2 Tax=Durusdinium trenchii TaxID=1381693 RepID=A0ABP0N2W3_9DINO